MFGKLARGLPHLFGGRGNEKGSIATMMGVLLGTGALLGLLALGFDMSVTYAEQQTLRLSSTAASYALAQKCAHSQPQCASQSAAVAYVQSVLNKDAADGISGIDEVCGVAPLSTCAPLTANQQDCKTVAAGTNFVRVTAKTQTPNGGGVQTIFSGLLDGNFTNNNNTGLILWQCAQSIWQVDPSASTQNIQFNLLLPACSYPNGSGSVVLFEFQDSGNTPNPPRAASCTIPLANGFGSYSLTNVVNGFPPVDISVGSCDTAVSITLNQVLFLNSNLKKFCGGDMGNLAAWLDGKIASGVPEAVAIPGAFTSPQANIWNITVIGFSKFKFLGYRLSNAFQGGATPTGGWSNWPAGVSSTAKCKASNPCIYGQYTSPPSFIVDNNVVKIVP